MAEVSQRQWRPVVKTHNHLFEAITSFENLIAAVRRAERGKRSQSSVGRFRTNIESEVLELQRQLREKTYSPGAYREKIITRPKERMISAAPFRDRVVHHALCRVVMPLFERRMIPDLYSNRAGKGTHAAIRRCQEFCRQYPYVLKCDIKKFFPSMDHAVLKAIIRRTIRCRSTLWLMDLIIDGSNRQEPVSTVFPGDDLVTAATSRTPTSHLETGTPAERRFGSGLARDASPFHEGRIESGAPSDSQTESRPTGAPVSNRPLSPERRVGLPIGNVTSQWFGCLYLDAFDHWVKEELRCPGYVRYVDDFLLFGRSKSELNDWRAAIAERLVGFRLRLNERKSRGFPTAQGITYLGQRIWPNRRRLCQANVRAARRRLRWNVRQFKLGHLSREALVSRWNSWRGHAMQADTGALVDRVRKELCDALDATGK